MPMYRTDWIASVVRFVRLLPRVDVARRRANSVRAILLGLRHSDQGLRRRSQRLATSWPGMDLYRRSQRPVMQSGLAISLPTGILPLPRRRWRQPVCPENLQLLCAKEGTGIDVPQLLRLTGATAQSSQSGHHNQRGLMVGRWRLVASAPENCSSARLRFGAARIQNLTSLLHPVGPEAYLEKSHTMPLEMLAAQRDRRHSRGLQRRLENPGLLSRRLGLLRAREAGVRSWGQR